MDDNGTAASRLERDAAVQSKQVSPGASGCAADTAPYQRSASLTQLFLSFFKIGAFTFGGGWAMVPLIQKQLCEKYGWLDDQEFVDILAIAQSGPGPIAINTSVLCGYRLRGLPGALVATLGSSLPSFITILVVAAFFLKIRDSSAVEAIFRGMRPAIFSLLVSAVCQVGRKSVRNRQDIMFALAGAVLLIGFKVNPVIAIAIAAAGGITLGVVKRGACGAKDSHRDREPR